jgi:hypothetical protein
MTNDPDIFNIMYSHPLNGFNGNYIELNHVARILNDVLRSAAYQGNVENFGSQALPAEGIYTDNLEYWKDAARNVLFSGKTIQLNGFWVSEWVPFSPGQYFTVEAEQSREIARRFFNPEYHEYVPLGKTRMVLGGIGCLRFLPRQVSHKEVFVLGASSSGVMHEGVPLTCEQDIYHYLAKYLKEAGGVLCDIQGFARLLPSDISGLKFTSGVEKYCIHIREIRIREIAKPDSILCTAQVLFPTLRFRDDYFGDAHSKSLLKSWSFASFRPGVEASPSGKTLGQAVNWLKDYVNRHSEGAPILSDFDEVQNHFTNPIEFPLTAIKQGKINLERLNAYQSDFSNNGISLEGIDGLKIPRIPGVKIFISYRRKDSLPITGRIFDHLANEFGRQNIFFDTNSIPTGANFRYYISSAIMRSKVVVAVIGPRWVNDQWTRRRLWPRKRREDYVEIELQVALERGVPILPILIEDASMPDITLLPQALKKLAYLNALPVRSGRDFDSDIAGLLSAIEHTCTRWSVASGDSTVEGLSS